MIEVLAKESIIIREMVEVERVEFERVSERESTSVGLSRVDMNMFMSIELI